jgi:hypothetical protein
MAKHPATLLQRSALGLWFLGLGALGLVRWWMRHARDAQADADRVMQLWLGGSVGLLLLGGWLLVRALYTSRR